MGDSFTNFLLVILISLLGFLGKAFYDKIEVLAQKLESILLSDVGQKKDIEKNSENIADHEVRITILEKHHER